MNILSITMGSATGGIPIAIARAFEGEDGYEARCLVSTINYLDYPQDVPWSFEAVHHYWEWADVIHLHHGFMTRDRVVKGRYTGRRLRDKPYVVEFHGTGFRESPEGFLYGVRQHKAVAVVSTLDLYLLAPDEVEWVPVPVNIGMLQELRRKGLAARMEDEKAPRD